MSKVQNLMKKLAVVRYKEATLTKACWNSTQHLRGSPTATTLMANRRLPQLPTIASAIPGVSKSYGNPCLDMFYYLQPVIRDFHMKGKDKDEDAYQHLKRLLPHAWSYNPLTTLKIIRHYDLYDYSCLTFGAIDWVYLNHPKTLVANLIPLSYRKVADDWNYYALTDILYRILNLKEDQVIQEQDDEEPLSNKVLEMDSDFRILHDEVARLFAESLKFDIQNFLKKEHDYENDENQVLELTRAIWTFTGVLELNFPLLFENVANRIFPHVGDVEAALALLREEVLEPLEKVFEWRSNKDGGDYSVNIYGYRNEDIEDLLRMDRSPIVYKYLKDLEQSTKVLVADAMLPNEFVDYVIDSYSGDVSSQVVDLQWKAMVDDLKKKEKLGSSLALIAAELKLELHPVFFKLSFALTILFSELNEEEAWKGKVISLTPNPQLLSIQGHDLKSKFEFVSGPANKGPQKYVDCKQVFDLILEQAVTMRLKPEQMIKRVFVFSGLKGEYDLKDEFEDISSGSDGSWEAQDYDKMRAQYKKHGYEIPHIVFWRANCHLDMPFTDSPNERGISAISGCNMANCSDTFVKMFLENDGHLSPQDAMDAGLEQDYIADLPFVVLD